MQWIVTGGAGFIGSSIVEHLNQEGVEEILIVDHLAESPKWKNLRTLRFAEYMDREEFLEAVKRNRLSKPEYILHLGAITNTAERNNDLLRRWNVEFTLMLAEYAISKKARFLYASSAAVYGDGSSGFSDSNDLLFKLLPLNPYGFSKLWVDRILFQRGHLEKIVGVRYFNVYGPREDHKGPMRSVIPIFYRQLKETGKVRLFRSHTPEIPDGEQKRDFVYADDAVEATLFLLRREGTRGIYNIGTGVARSFLEIVEIMLSQMSREIGSGSLPHRRNLQERIEWIPMPPAISDAYQNYTQAEIQKLLSAGYDRPFRPIEEGIPLYLSYLRRHPPRE